MANTILVPIDGSEHSREALSVAIEEFDDAELIVLHVIEPYNVFSVTENAARDDEVLEERRSERAALLEESREFAADRGVNVRTELMLGSPSRAIVDACEEFDVDHVVMGSRGRTGLSRLVLGSVADTVVKRAPTTVTVVRSS
ncbi:universal stress protein [Halobacteria archaeon AArc-curdl1]|uniref:Universal stress protein n=1 Tax=Natronosalvus hydrolyticus TaxID=2979988 RepID=A0AAP2Z527_9EURY|nr:universal stress protein [Halobacteria archaeon AArc-curdl1]